MRTHLDLFSGIGGFALACRWAGVETIGFAEIDDYACKVLAKNFPGVTNYGDIRTIPAGLSAWLVTGGFPCQPFSVAGQRRGADDDRWLWPAMAAVVAAVRPAWVLAENVPGIVGMELDTVLFDLETSGYTAWPIIVPACAVDAQHRRDRVWIVAHADNTERWAHDSAWGHDSGRNDADSLQGRQEIPGGFGLCGAETLAHADTSRWDGRSWQQRQGWRLESADGSGADVAYANGTGLAQRESIAGDARPQCAPTERSHNAAGKPSIWQPEPDVGRVAHGIPNRVDRLRGLGNAIVPQVAYQLIRMMIEAEQ